MQKTFCIRRKIRVGFYVIYTGAFPARSLIDEMLNFESIDFEPIIVATPDIMRGKQNMIDELEAVVNEFNGKYVKVLSAYDAVSDTFIDHSSLFDFACLSNPYDSMTHEFCRNEYLNSKGVKTFYIHYSYSVTNFDIKIFNMDSFSIFWKVFISNPITLQELSLSGCNVSNYSVVGYPKVDNIKSSLIDPLKKKIVILAPHHTFNYVELNLSSFEKFADLFWMLPQRFPDLDFVFRPHPLWKINLKKFLYWPDSKIDAYINKILSNKNVSLSVEGDYIDLFNRSSALIHDCGSFIAEYLYTEKPCCFLMRNPNIYSLLNLIGKKCLDLHFHAYESYQVLEFLENLCSASSDVADLDRIDTINKYVKIEHKLSSSKILEQIAAG